MKFIKHKFDRHYHENIVYRESANSQRNRQRLKTLMEYRQTGHLLEIGCGKAGFLRLAEEYFNVEGVDISSYAIQSIRQHFGERVKVMNIEQHRLPAQTYDVIAVFNILEHLHRPPQIVDRLHAALTGGGIMIGSVPNNQGLVGGLITRIGNFFDRTHISTLPPDTWRRIFKKAGFQQIEFFGEVTFGRNHCRYIHRSFWPSLAFNLMFVCQK